MRKHEETLGQSTIGFVCTTTQSYATINNGTKKNKNMVNTSEILAAGNLLQAMQRTLITVTTSPHESSCPASRRSMQDHIKNGTRVQCSGSCETAPARPVSFAEQLSNTTHYSRIKCALPNELCAQDLI